MPTKTYTPPPLDEQMAASSQRCIEFIAFELLNYPEGARRELRMCIAHALVDQIDREAKEGSQR